MFQLSEFVSDYLQLSSKDFSAKYFLKVPKSVKVQDVIDHLEKTNSMNSFIDESSEISKRFASIYLIRHQDGSYEYFEYEDKGKMYSCVFADIKEALAEKIKNIFLQLGHPA